MAANEERLLERSSYLAKIERVTVTVAIGIMTWEASISLLLVGGICTP